MVRSAGRRRMRIFGALVVVTVAVLGALSAAGAVTIPGLGGSSNDLGRLGPGLGQMPAKAPVAYRAEPPLRATPVAPCGPGSRPERSVDGRVPAGTGDHGLWCNLTEVSHQGTSGGFKVFRYVDTQGHVCAFYDTALLFPTNAINAAGASLGVAVLDMSDPAHPLQTATLTQPSMLTPHESLNLNPARGLLAAVNGNPATEPGLFSIYDVHADCRHPVLDSTTLGAPLGHESGFSADGKTFYATATAAPSITAIDVSDPTHPHAIWQGDIVAHGMTLSADGNRAYVADPTGGDMLILDTSQIQARKPNPQAREISRLGWKTASIPQNAIPFSEHGHPYVLEFDEYTAGTLSPTGSRDTVGAARIIDIANEAAPRVVANLRLAVDQPAEHHAAGNDPGTFSPAQGYAAHYCNMPTRVNPTLVACSFIASGLRLFNISDLLHPREIGYFVAPTTPNTETGYTESDYAMSQPTFDVARHEIWYTDGGTGFYVVKVADAVWPRVSAPGSSGCPATRGRLAGRQLGPVRLGMTRAAARRALRGGGTYVDPLCPAVHVLYGAPKQLSGLPARSRSALRGRVVAAWSTSRRFALRGVKPGMRLAAARRRLRLRRGVGVAASTWYVVGNGSSAGLLEIRRGMVVAVGIADRRLTRGSAQTRRLLRALG
jgi:hypothetical protein